LALALLSNRIVLAQQTPAGIPPPQNQALTTAIHELQEQVQELRGVVGELRSEGERYRSESLELRRDLEATRAQLASYLGQTTASAQTPTGGQSIEGRVARLEEESQLQTSKIDEQYQTKVESASKYRVRLSGIILLNMFSNRGTVDNQDIPNLALANSPLDARGNFGGTLRQSQVGLEVFGPSVAGARTTGDIEFDLAGGFPEIANGVNAGLFRLRTATMRLDWARTSVVAGQDNIFFSPLSPTSFASLAIPAFGYAGNLWAWVPQVRVEHRFSLSDLSSLTLQGGILDNLTGEVPPFQSLRVPQAGERSSQPGYGVRVAWNRPVVGQPMTLGVGGYYSNQDWAFNRHVDGWATTADWDVPLTRWFTLSGEFYAGEAVGGLGGAIGRSVAFSGPPTDPASQVRGIDSLGGWSQLKFKPTSRLEFNGAFGDDNAAAGDLLALPFGSNNPSSSPARNRGSFVNFIHRPSSNLLFSMEYRRLRTFPISGNGHTATHINAIMGVLF
jgi:hypothetical protein